MYHVSVGAMILFTIFLSLSYSKYHSNASTVLIFQFLSRGEGNSANCFSVFPIFQRNI